MLHANVARPFVFGAKGLLAAVAGENASIRPGVASLDVLVESGLGGEVVSAVGASLGGRLQGVRV